MQLALAYDASSVGADDWNEVLAWFSRACDVLGHKEVAFKLDIGPSQLSDAIKERERKDVKGKWIRTVLRMCPESLVREYLEIEARQLGYEVKKRKTRTPEEIERERRKWMAQHAPALLELMDREVGQ